MRFVSLVEEVFSGIPRPPSRLLLLRTVLAQASHLRSGWLAVASSPTARPPPVCSPSGTIGSAPGESATSQRQQPGQPQSPPQPPSLPHVELFPHFSGLAAAAEQSDEILSNTARTVHRQNLAQESSLVHIASRSLARA